MGNLKKKISQKESIYLDNVVFQILIILAKAKEAIDYWTNIYKCPARLL